MENLVWLIYSHMDYDDVLEITLKRFVKYGPSEIKLAVCTNDIEHIRNKYTYCNFHALYQYDDTAEYGERLRSVLCKIPEKYVLLNHEHDILVDKPDMDVLNMLLQKLEIENIDQMRLTTGSADSPVFDKDIAVRPIDGAYKMAVSTTIWRRESLLSIATEFASHSYRCFECDVIQEYVSKMKNYYLLSNKDVQYIGEGHYFSYYIPCAHCTHYGKWRTSTPTAKKFVDDIVSEYGIDIYKRGVN